MGRVVHPTSARQVAGVSHGRGQALKGVKGHAVPGRPSVWEELFRSLNGRMIYSCMGGEGGQTVHVPNRHALHCWGSKEFMREEVNPWVGEQVMLYMGESPGRAWGRRQSLPWVSLGARH